jgi:tripartite-type tricarboxylate transporter receptor subunit TctC
MQKLRWLTAGVLLFGTAQFTNPAMAQQFPAKQPIKIIVPVPAGGPTDVMARITAEFLGHRLGQVVIVENKPGASSTIGAGFVARSPADGYTMLFMGGEFSVVPAVRNVPYNLDSFTYLVRPFTISSVLVASPKFPVSSVQDLVAKMKANPGQVRYGTTGIGAIIHLGMAMFESGAGVKGLHVPYQGIAPVYQDLLSGTVDITETVPPMPDGFKVLAATGKKRNPTYPDVPTLEEAGIKNATWDSTFAFYAPANLPKPIADRLISEITAVVKDPAAIAKYKAAINTVPDTEPLAGEAMKKQVLEDYKMWKTVVEREKIVPQ